VLPDPLGALDYTAGPAKVAQSIRIIIETEPGERIMRPSFGCGLRRYLMRPNTTATRALIRHDVELGLGNFEPRIRVTDIAVDPGDDPALVLIRIAYVHLRDKTPGNLVYPFYLE
jgi:phage baseplate assembly protein W